MKGFKVQATRAGVVELLCVECEHSIVPELGMPTQPSLEFLDQLAIEHRWDHHRPPIIIVTPVSPHPPLAVPNPEWQVLAYAAEGSSGAPRAGF